MTPEGYVKKAVEDLLKAERIPYWRMNAGNVVLPGRGRIRLNAPGTADILAAPQIPDGFARSIPCFLWIETKAPKGKPTKIQMEFADFVRNQDHEWLLVDDVLVLINWLKEHRAR